MRLLRRFYQADRENGLALATGRGFFCWRFLERCGLLACCTSFAGGFNRNVRRIFNAQSVSESADIEGEIAQQHVQHGFTQAAYVFETPEAIQGEFGIAIVAGRAVGVG